MLKNDVVLDVALKAPWYVAYDSSTMGRAVGEDAARMHGESARTSSEAMSCSANIMAAHEQRHILRASYSRRGNEWV